MVHFSHIFARNKALFSLSAFKAMSSLKHDAYMILLKEQEKQGLEACTGCPDNFWKGFLFSQLSNS